ncbi:NADPH:quinone reductase [Erythrobacter sp. SG61-1L]|uniref:zinc-dependent alcohol dehydrogenase family protein n=1 Tax=Erythrobacter sp. SG61-1L TaxID=1603897 RepID=UPI0006C91E15|nr:zinc-dependent alcohol dehydrogenase family protein [Erythrobacter sp. SG61-1L]KPL67561.1 NADPH:quinone reductase [Erythrobacter sp. SG61-1L]
MAKIIRLHRQGGPEVLQFEEIELPAPGAGEVRIKVEAIGLNRSEAMYRAGRYPVPVTLPCFMGYEAAGTILALGDGVEGFTVGDKVSVVPKFQLGTYGVWGEEAIVPAHALLPAPEGLSMAEAASVWMQYFTAFALIEVANVGIGDAAIIRAASSSVGLAAIQLANWAGATSIACTRTSAKADALKALGAAHVVATEEEDLVERVMQITGDKGARCAFDPVGGPYVFTLASSLAERGILFIYGGLSETETPYAHWPCAMKGASMRGWVASEIWNNPERYKRAQRVIYQGLAEGRLKPVISKVFSLDQIGEANAYLESNQQIGKVVVTV